MTEKILQNVKATQEASYRRFVFESAENLRKYESLLKSFDSVKIKTKAGGRAYVNVYNNFVYSKDFYMRKYRGYKWIEFSGDGIVKTMSLDGLTLDQALERIEKAKSGVIENIKIYQTQASMSFDEYMKI